MNLDDLEYQNRNFDRFFGDFWLRHISRVNASKLLGIDRDSLCMKLSALNVVFTTVVYILPFCV